MEARSMEITLISARDLNNTSMLSKTKAYAVAWISNDQKNRQWTPVDEENGTNPTWNQVMNFTLDEAALQQGRLLLEIAIYTNSTFGDKEIGRVSIPLIEFLKPAGSNKGTTTSAQFVSYQVRKPSGKAKGVLNLSVTSGEKFDCKQQQQPREAVTVDFKQQQQSMEAVTGSYAAAKTEPVTAYPVYLSAGSSSQLPPYSPVNNQYPRPPNPPQAGYPPPPPHHQGYPPPPPPPHHQGYPPPPPPPHHQGYPPPPPPPPLTTGVTFRLPLTIRCTLHLRLRLTTGVTFRLRLTTGVTLPTRATHPTRVIRPLFLQRSSRLGRMINSGRVWVQALLAKLLTVCFSGVGNVIGDASHEYFGGDF